MVTKAHSILFGPLPPPYGGVSVFMDAICDHVVSHGASVWSYKGKKRPSGSENGVRYVNHRKLNHIRALLRDGRAARITDSTHFHLEYPNPLLLPAWLAAKRFLRFEWIKILHDGSLPSRYERFTRAQKQLFRAAIRDIDEFIVYSRELETWLRDVAVFAGKISFIPLLLPLPAGWGDARVDANLTATLERFAGHRKRVSSIGVFIPSYGFHNVADAVEKIREETNDDVGLLLVDGEFARDDEYRERVLRERPWIEVAPSVPNPALGQVFKQSQVFVRAFEHESFGLSRIEALWCGVPVIATNVGETRGMMLYDYGDVNALRGHLETVFAGEVDIDVEKWADIFQLESEENLDRYIEVITGSTAKINAD